MRAFTLLETMITLIIFAGLLLLSVVQLKGYRDELILDNTSRELRSTIEQAARVSTIRHEGITITYFPVSKRLCFKNKNYFNKLDLDKSVKIDDFPKLEISSNGIMAPRTITLISRKGVRKIKLQMMWGRAISD